MRMTFRLLVVVCALGAAVSTSRAQNTPPVYAPGNGVSLPILLTEVRPNYTQEAKDARIQGTVLLECVVESDGRVGEVKVSRSLDAVLGLDQEAIGAAKQWRFKPGEKDGKPVAVRVQIEIRFALK